MQAWGRAVPIDFQLEGSDAAGDSLPTSIAFWLLSKGSSFNDPPLMVAGDVQRSLTSPDASKILTVNLVANGGKFADIFVVPTDGSAAHKIGRVLVGGRSDEAGVLTPYAWLPQGGWLAVSVCPCDASPLRWYTISPEGKVATAAWLGVPGDIYPGVSRDGRYLSMYQVPVRDCGVENVCPNGPARVLVADLVSHRIQVLAEYRNDLSRRETAISPDGTLVAAPKGSTRTVQVFDRKTGHILSTFSFGKFYLDPAAFIDDSTLLLQGTSDATSGPDALFMAKIEFGRVRIVEVAKDLGPPFIGWTR